MFYKFVHASMFGSYYVDCEAELYGAGLAQIRYVCPVEEIEKTAIIKASELIPRTDINDLDESERVTLFDAHQDKMNNA